ncbi:MAG: nucleoside triphosphate pyrophosphohydrolase [Desulfovibrio sp.]|nr:nucleoside triphosphate pyrophosphohydrolase [Desulfovibrio sp.]
MPSQALEKLLAVIDKLVGPDGCPWDKEQTPERLGDYIIEESHELVSAIRSGSAADVCEELGDVAFLLLFVSRLYERQGKFRFGDALDASREKMIRRHPHVFGDRVFSGINEQLEAWEQIKRAEHAEGRGARQGVFVALPDTLPPLIKAYRIHSKAARAGFTWEDDEAAAQQVEAEWLEWLDAAVRGDAEAGKHEFGDLLFSLVELGRRKGIKASEALDLAARRFLRRFARMEELAGERGQDFVSLSPDEKDSLWNRAKAEESSSD